MNLSILLQPTKFVEGFGRFRRHLLRIIFMKVLSERPEGCYLLHRVLTVPERTGTTFNVSRGSLPRLSVCRYDRHPGNQRARWIGYSSTQSSVCCLRESVWQENNNEQNSGREKLSHHPSNMRSSSHVVFFRTQKWTNGTTQGKTQPRSF